MTISWKTVIFKFRWIFGTDERRNLSRQTIHIRRPVEAHALFCVSFVATDQRTCTKTPYGGLSRHNSQLIRRKNPAKFENDRISRNGHRIKITQPNWMIKASFSSAEDAPSNNIKIYNTFSSQCTENPPFRFFWDTRYSNAFIIRKQHKCSFASIIILIISMFRCIVLLLKCTLGCYSW